MFPTAGRPDVRNVLAIRLMAVLAVLANELLVPHRLLALHDVPACHSQLLGSAQLPNHLLLISHLPPPFHDALLVGELECLL